METADYDSTGQLTGVSNFRFRAPGSSNWLDLSKFDSRNEVGDHADRIRCGDQPSLSVEQEEWAPGALPPAARAHCSAGRGCEQSSLRYRRVVRLRRDGPVVGYTYTDDRPEVAFFDPTFSKIVTDLGKVLTDDPLVDLSGISRDGNKILIHAAADRDPGAYYVFDRQTRTLDFALEDRDSLAKVPLAPMRRVDVPTATDTRSPLISLSPRATLRTARGRSAPRRSKRTRRLRV